MAEIIARGTPDSNQKTDGKLTPAEAGYMELHGALKDALCEKVQGQISSERGCCNLYEPQTDYTESFKCGVCEYLVLK